MSWFAKRHHSASQKLAKDVDCSVSAEKGPIRSSDTPGKQPPAHKFNTLAAAVIGKKPKRQHPTLPIQEPLSPQSSPAEPQRRYSSRPPSKSVSTVRSGDDSIEPRTPSDAPRNRSSCSSFPRSVLTLSDPDPFAASAITVPSSTIQASRVSVLSKVSNELYVKSNDALSSLQRASFASSSSKSQDTSFELTRSALSSPPTSVVITDPGSTRPISAESSWDYTAKPSLVKSTSVATLTENTRKPSPPILRPRLPSRPMDAGFASSIAQLPSKNVSDLSMSLIPPMNNTRPLNRHSSTSRVVINPPNAPPLTKLPPVPTAVPISPVRFSVQDDENHLYPTHSGSDSSSSISFASSNSSSKDLHLDERRSTPYRSTRDRKWGLDKDFGSARRTKECDYTALADVALGPEPVSNDHLSTSPQTLKKAVSVSTLHLPKDNFPLPPGWDKSPELELKKQRSFHQSRYPPPLSPPLRHLNSYVPPRTSSLPQPISPVESRKGGPAVTSPIIRKRLFSGSSRKLPTFESEDDDRSLVSIPTDSGHRSTGRSLRAGESLANEPLSDTFSITSGSTTNTDYAPQRIMSPAEMFKVEASLQDELDAKYGDMYRNRSRGVSLTSASTSFLAVNHSISDLSQRDGRVSLAPSHPPSRSSSTIAKSTSPSLCLNVSPRPGSAQPSATATTPVDSPVENPSALVSVGLPLPRGLRSRPTTADTMSSVSSSGSRRLSTTPINPLSPRPSLMRRQITPQYGHADRASNPIVRKPSFLEIADESPSLPYPASRSSFVERPLVSKPPAPIPCEEDSFLDMGKDSLDVSRDSLDEFGS